MRTGGERVAGVTTTLRRAWLIAGTCPAASGVLVLVVVTQLVAGASAARVLLVAVLVVGAVAAIWDVRQGGWRLQRAWEWQNQRYEAALLQWRWPHITASCGLHTAWKDHERRPRLRSVTVDQDTAQATASLPPTMTAATVIAETGAILSAWEGHGLIVTPSGRNGLEVRLLMARRDLLAEGIDPDRWLARLASPFELDAVPWAMAATGAVAVLDGRNHCAFYGPTGAGKGSHLRSLALSLRLATTPANLVLCEDKGTDLRIFDVLGQTAAYADNTASSIINVLADVQSVVAARYAAMARAGVTNLWRSPDLLSAVGGAISVIIDDLPAVVAWDRTVAPVVSNLATQARAAGVALVVSAQLPLSAAWQTAGLGQVRSSIVDVVQLRTLRATDSDVGLGAGAAARGLDASRIPAQQKGTGIQLSSELRCRPPELSDADITLALTSVPPSATLASLLTLALAWPPP